MCKKAVRTINSETFRKIKWLIQKKCEGDYWDYKQEWHSDNERLLHDILCFANTVHDKDCYLIIGVADDGTIIGLNEESPYRKNQVCVLDLLANTVFAGDYIPKISVETVELQGLEVDVLTVYNSFEVPYYLKSKNKKYNFMVCGFIYSRIGDRNTPINQNSHIQQIEMLWKKRLGLLSPPLKQIVLSLKNKSDWAQVEETYFNINNPDFKIEEDRHWDDEEYGIPKSLEFYSYNQVNTSTSYIDLKIICRQTVLKTIQTVILDSGRYLTPVPTWAFIHDVSKHLDVLYTYKYILMNSTEYAVQQFLFDQENSEAEAAKNRFDEVVLYFEDEQEQQRFHRHIEQQPSVIEDYIADAQLDTYVIESNNPLEIKDSTKKLITAFALKRYLVDWRRVNLGIKVKRINNIKVICRTLLRYSDMDVFEHRLSINGNGRVYQSVYTKASTKAKERYVYRGDKYWTRDLLNILEPISTEWETDYTVEYSNDFEWICIIKYTDGTRKIVKGNIAPPDYESVERRIENLVKYKVDPWIFSSYS